MRRRPAQHVDIQMPAHAVSIGSAVQGRATERDVLPVLFENQVKAVIDAATVTEFTICRWPSWEQLTGNIGIVLNSIEANDADRGAA